MKSQKKLIAPKKSNFSVEEAIGIPIEIVKDPYPMKNRIPFAERCPEFAKQWLYKEDCGYTPWDFSCGSGVNVWWQCKTEAARLWHPTKNLAKLEEVMAQAGDFGWWLSDKGHEWQRIVYLQTVRGYSCPVCNGSQRQSNL